MDSYIHFLKNSDLKELRNGNKQMYVSLLIKKNISNLGKRKSGIPGIDIWRISPPYLHQEVKG